jgi:hypothetical protein
MSKAKAEIRKESSIPSSKKPSCPKNFLIVNGLSTKNLSKNCLEFASPTAP